MQAKSAHQHFPCIQKKTKKKKEGSIYQLFVAAGKQPVTRVPVIVKASTFKFEPIGKVPVKNLLVEKFLKMFHLKKIIRFRKKN